MSVVDDNTVDGIALTDDNEGIVLLLSDHLDWDDEYNHLLILQEKLNAYIYFLEEKQYEEIYSNANIVYGMVVYEKVIEKHLMAELPFMASENIMMNQVKKGGDRQELHERIRELSQIAGKNVKEKGLENNLLELIEKDDFFDISKDELNEVLNPMKYIGRCPSQVDEFIENEVNPILEENKNMIENIKEVEI